MQYGGCPESPRPRDVGNRGADGWALSGQPSHGPVPPHLTLTAEVYRDSRSFRSRFGRSLRPGPGHYGRNNKGNAQLKIRRRYETPCGPWQLIGRFTCFRCGMIEGSVSEAPALLRVVIRELRGDLFLEL